MERNDRAAVATFFSESDLSPGETVRLTESAAHHARVRRLEPGDVIRLTDGAGTRASAELLGDGRKLLEARVIDTQSVPLARAIHLRAPIGDRDRMLWLAEKATELGITSWQAVRFRRSTSVSPRGEGPAFATKVRARMIAALEQSGGAWLPEVRAETEPSQLNVPSGAAGFLLDECGEPVLGALAAAIGEVVIALGPEGGMDPEERELLAARGWRSVRLGPTTLRFETAAIAAVAIARATTVTEDA